VGGAISTAVQKVKDTQSPELPAAITSALQNLKIPQPPVPDLSGAIGGALKNVKISQPPVPDLAGPITDAFQRLKVPVPDLSEPIANAFQNIRQTQAPQPDFAAAFQNIRVMQGPAPDLNQFVGAVSSNIANQIKYIPPPQQNPTLPANPRTEYNQLLDLFKNAGQKLEVHVSEGAVQQNISTWSLGATRDLIKNQIAPELLKSVGDGGDLHTQLLGIVTQMVTDKSTITK